jgi:hypothetical protein
LVLSCATALLHSTKIIIPATSHMNALQTNILIFVSLNMGTGHFAMGNSLIRKRDRESNSGAPEVGLRSAGLLPTSGRMARDYCQINLAAGFR